MRLLGNIFVKFLLSILIDGCFINWNVNFNFVIDFLFVNEVFY